MNIGYINMCDDVVFVDKVDTPTYFRKYRQFYPPNNSIFDVIIYLNTFSGHNPEYPIKGISERTINNLLIPKSPPLQPNIEVKE